MKEYKGTVAQVQGPVVDVQFARDEMPAIKDALWLEVGGQKRVMEVSPPMCWATSITRL